MILLELFSGIGGFAKGLTDAGFAFRKVYFSEIDKHAIANYQYNFKDAEYIGSVANVRHIIRTINAAMQPGEQLIITFGSPCQDFSLAGKGHGLNGTKSSLIKFALFLIRWLRPDIYIWENVKGAFSTNNGADFWAIQKAFANIHGYRREQQLLNTAWFLPQNRERIYLVGHLATGSWGRVFPIGEYDKLFNWKEGEGEGEGQRFRMYNTQANTISQRYYKDGSENLIATNLQGNDISNTIRNGVRHSLSDKHNWDMAQITSATSSGYEVAEVGDSINYSVPNSETRRGRVGKGKAQTLDTQCNQAVIVASRGRGENNEQVLEERKDGLTNTLTGVSKDNLVKQINPSTESGGKQPYQQNRVYDAEGISPTIDQAAGKWGIKALSFKRSEEAKQIRKENMAAGKDYTPFSKKEISEREDGLIGIITANTKKDNLLKQQTQIRRLTEIECERLQGFPDDWTKWGNYNGVIKQIPKTQRYKQCGNAVSVCMPYIIGKKLLNKQ